MNVLTHFWKNAINFTGKSTWKESIKGIIANLILIILLYIIPLLAPVTWEQPILNVIELFQLISIVPTVAAIVRAIKR